LNSNFKEVNKIDYKKYIFKTLYQDDCFYIGSDQLNLYDKNLKLIKQIDAFKNKNKSLLVYEIAKKNNYIAVGGEICYSTIINLNNFEIQTVLPTSSYTKSIHFWDNEIFIAGNEKFVYDFSLNGELLSQNDVGIMSVYNLNFINDTNSYFTTGFSEKFTYTKYNTYNIQN
jgi:hypothetical protein